MAYPQPGLFALGTRRHHHLELDRHPGVPAADVADALRGLREPAVTVGGANIVVGFGADLWAELAPAGARPERFRPFAGVAGIDGFAAPAAQHDVWVWIHGTGEDVVLDVARAVADALAKVATVAVDQPGFVYRDSRDLTGFVDGTANPPIEEAPFAVCLPDGAPGAGGAFVLVQRWVHDLARFATLPVAEQELVFGRTKADSVELDDDAKPDTAHIARTELVDDDGGEREVFRRSVPFGSVEEQGLYFVAFGRDQERFDDMLARMYGLGDDGLRDRLLDFSRPVTGAYYFAPSLDALNELVVLAGDGDGDGDDPGAGTPPAPAP